MDLHSGLPYWIVKNALYDHYQPLRKNIRTRVAIIGSGITGSLVVHELCKRGIECVVVDKRSLGFGSTAASTAQLQYEIDVPLSKLISLVGEKNAETAYRNCLQSIDDLQQVLQETNTSESFQRVPTYLLASDKTGHRMLEREYTVRQKAGLPVDFLSANRIAEDLGTFHSAALYNDSSAQMDCYAASIGILDYYGRHGKTALYSNTLITKYQKSAKGYRLSTADECTIECDYVVIAAGFEAGEFLPKRVMDLLSTYVILSEPIEEKYLWNKRALLWETKAPYLYMRTTADNRIIVGGEDVPFSSPDKRDDLLREKSKRLERKFRKWFPDIPFVTEMSWCGTFSSTSDGLPFIGAWPRNPRMLFTLGYGGNGVTFSMIGAQVIAQVIEGKKDARLKLYGFDRPHISG
ncbi:NAD(P)/FAD-dependent oxidoreductase [Sphingobacterium suaedae]|uniref:NAD(P)/FAD-dependent oxidoreductase n=1 Tax=Sphingobacterium suaedae TaxID=1686402 RepID=A0ABW5KLH2_9SPHI